MKMAILLVLILVAAPAFGQESWQKDGKATPDTESMRAKDGFGAQFILTESTKVFDDWNKPKTPHVITLKNNEAHRGVPFFTVLLFSNPGIDSKGNADVTAEITIRKPDGKIYGTEDLAVWKGKSQATREIQLSREKLGIRIAPEDPGGTYTVEADVKDNVKNVELRLKTIFVVAPR